MSDLERIKELEYQIDNIQAAYAKEISKIYNSKGFDLYAPKWDNKIKKCASKYADLILPLKMEHEELRLKVIEEDEIIRKKKYKDL